MQILRHELRRISSVTSNTRLKSMQAQTWCKQEWKMLQCRRPRHVANEPYMDHHVNERRQHNIHGHRLPPIENTIDTNMTAKVCRSLGANANRQHMCIPMHAARQCSV